MSEFSRPCTECGKIHDTGMQNIETGIMETRFEKCYDCFMKTGYTVAPITVQITLDALDLDNLFFKPYKEV